MEPSEREVAEEIRGLLLENEVFQENCDWVADGPDRCVTVIFEWQVLVDQIKDSRPGMGMRERLRVRYGLVPMIDEEFEGWKLFEMAKAKAMGPEGVQRAFRNLAKLAETMEETDRLQAELENRSIESPG